VAVWVAVAWVEVAEVADLKRKEYRNDIRQLAPLRKPIEDGTIRNFVRGGAVEPIRPWRM